MKKTIAILLFALPFMTLKVTAQSEVIKTGTIETINADGTGLLKDISTGELKEYITRDGEFHRGLGSYLSRDGEFHRGNGAKKELIVGLEVSYLTIQDEGKGFSSLIR